MLEIKLLIFTLIILFYYFPTMAFCSNGFDQRIQRKQAQPCINQMLTQLERLSKLDAQLKFLFLCRNLEHEEDWKKRKIKEALYINAMDSKEIMNLEKGFEINPCWNEFNPHIRNIAQKKGKS